jgi:sulfur relay (sulfurtransferase) DsrF/TusC family protein
MASYMSEPTTVLIQDGTNLLCNKKPDALLQPECNSVVTLYKYFIYWYCMVMFPYLQPDEKLTQWLGLFCCND